MAIEPKTNDSCQSIVELFAKTKSREKRLTDFILQIYVKIRNNEAYRPKELKRLIEELANEYNQEELEKHLHLHKLKYDG